MIFACDYNEWVLKIPSFKKLSKRPRINKVHVTHGLYPKSSEFVVREGRLTFESTENLVIHPSCPWYLQAESRKCQMSERIVDFK